MCPEYLDREEPSDPERVNHRGGGTEALTECDVSTAAPPSKAPQSPNGTAYKTLRSASRGLSL